MSHLVREAVISDVVRTLNLKRPCAVTRRPMYVSKIYINTCTLGSLAKQGDLLRSLRDLLTSREISGDLSTSLHFSRDLSRDLSS